MALYPKMLPSPSIETVFLTPKVAVVHQYGNRAAADGPPAYPYSRHIILVCQVLTPFAKQTTVFFECEVGMFLQIRSEEEYLVFE